MDLDAPVGQSTGGSRPFLTQSYNERYNIYSFIHIHAVTYAYRERERDIDIDQRDLDIDADVDANIDIQYTNKDLSTAPAMKPRLNDATQSSDRGSQGEHGSTILNSPPLSKSKASPASLQTMSRSSFSQVWHT